MLWLAQVERIVCKSILWTYTVVKYSNYGKARLRVFETRGFKNEVGFVSTFQGSHGGWRNYGWQERQSKYFTEWAYEHFADKLGLTATELSVVERFYNQPVENNGTTFAPAVIRTQAAFDALYNIMFSSEFIDRVGVEMAAVYRYSLLFSPVSNTDLTKPLLTGVSEEEGGFLTLAQYQNLLTDALEDEGPHYEHYFLVPI